MMHHVDVSLETNIDECRGWSFCLSYPYIYVYIGTDTGSSVVGLSVVQQTT